MAEDGNGFIWFSTGSGVQRFDGRQFHQVPVSNTPKGLPDDKYVHFFRLQNGHLWITHNKGISEYNSHTNSFSPVYQFKDTAAGHITYCLREEKDKVLCLANNTLLQVYKKDNRATNVADIPITGFPFAASPSKNFIAVTDTTLFILPLSKELHAVQLSTGRSTIISATREQQCFNAIEKLNNEYLLVATARGIEKMNLRNGAFSFICKYPAEPDLNKQTFPVHFQPGKDGIIIVTVGDQIFELDINTGLYISQLVNLQNQSFLNNGYIIACMADCFNNLWALSVNDGVKKINYSFPGFRYFGTASRANNFVKSIYVDKAANLVFSGTYNYGLFIFDTSQQLIRHINTFPGAKPSYTVCGIDKLAANRYLLYLMGGADAYLLNTQNFTLQKLSVAVKKNGITQPVAPSKIFDYYLSLPQPSHGKRLLQSYNSLYKVDYTLPAKLQLELIDTIDNTSICAYTDRQQRVWIGSPGSYYLLQPKDDASFSHASYTLPGKTLARCFYNDKSGNMWMGTEKGLYLLNSNGSVHKIFGRANGLPDDCIYSMREDNKGNVWLTHNKGITCMSKGGSFLHFNKSDGLQENEFNTNTSFETADGELYFGGVNGISSFYPLAITDVSDTPRVLVSGIKVKDEYWKNDTAYWSIGQLDLTYDNNIVSFEFTALGLRNPNQYNYQYQLAGVDPSWINAGNNPGARYILTPGQYTLRYYAGNDFDKSAKNYNQVYITIHRPVWKKGWFTAILIVIALGLLYFLISFYSKRKFRRQLRELETQRSIQQERERISRELHDNIGAQLSFISSTLDWITDSPGHMTRQEETQRLGAINTTAKHVINDLRETIWALKKESVAADELADRLKLFVRSQQPQTEINITEQAAAGTLFSPTDALNMFRICQEAIMNCIKHACASVMTIDIQAGKNDGFLITITDDGKGFEQKEEYPGHYGLENMEHRAAELGAKLVIESEPGKGARIKISR